MSEEEDFVFNNEEDEGEGIGDVVEDEGDEDNTPEGKYQKAKGLLGFNDLDAIDLFYDVYCEPGDDIKLQGKALKRAVITLSQTEDYERILASLTDVFAANADGIINDELCSKIVRTMMINVSRNEQALNDFMNSAIEKINKSTQLPLFVDVKLRQAETALKKADYNSVQQDLSEVEQYVGIPPDKADKQMCQSAVRILLLQIELTDAYTQDEEAIFRYYKTIKEIPNVILEDRQTAVLEKIAGLMALHNKDFNTSTKELKNAFELFDKSGFDKRLDCLPFLALSIMCQEDKETMFFSDPRITPFINHPIVAPLKQILDQFKDSNYVKFINLLDSAKKVFQQKAKNADLYFSLLDKVRVFVLRNNIKDFCLSYKRLEFNFLADELKCSVEEARKLVYDLIISHELNAVVDTETNLIIMKVTKPKSIYLDSVQTMLDSLGNTVKRLSRREKILL